MKHKLELQENQALQLQSIGNYYTFLAGNSYLAKVFCIYSIDENKKYKVYDLNCDEILDYAFDYVHRIGLFIIKSKNKNHVKTMFFNDEPTSPPIVEVGDGCNKVYVGYRCNSVILADSNAGKIIVTDYSLPNEIVIDAKGQITSEIFYNEDNRELSYILDNRKIVFKNIVTREERLLFPEKQITNYICTWRNMTVYYSDAMGNITIQKIDDEKKKTTIQTGMTFSNLMDVSNNDQYVAISTSGIGLKIYNTLNSKLVYEKQCEFGNVIVDLVFSFDCSRIIISTEEIFMDYYIETIPIGSPISDKQFADIFEYLMKEVGARTKKKNLNFSDPQSHPDFN